MSNNYSIGGVPDLTEILGAGFVTAVDGLKPSNDNTLLCALKAAAAANCVANVNINDIIGNKDDTPRDFVHANYGLMNYMKGIIQEIDQRTIPHMIHTRIAAIAYADVINITDLGVLTGFAAIMNSGADAAATAFARFTIDGTLFCTPSESILRKTAVDHRPMISFPFNHRFNTSLLIEGYTNLASSPVDFFVMYTTD